MKHKSAINLAKDKLPEKRYRHSKRVAETAIEMAEIYGGDKNKCFLAGILHDFSKYDELSEMYQYVTRYKLDPELLEFKSEVLHGPVAAVKMREEHGVTDEEIFYAIMNHTTGRRQMSLNEKIIYVADYIEPDRTQPGVEGIRDIVFQLKNLDKAVYEITKANILHLVSKDRAVYRRTLECLNYYNMVKE
ncbi:bis(5'-nucleosyl)-tetraphosphatase (symmetrical) YqeK [Salinicoccus hispanicus]|uniref:bis(5'-nucleosyl)-tetraphosphatase (symmetrical) n=1 Tax=Salinicoccus hispanicus TaxID=157225 RepID=A0A6N8U328_9STAP|nr:bis(5'-nucleosyl)-tetraphosphatase (symmetrical) YqeK [Salinicoccus hispanicus]MXQ50069.1 HD domain-containing protein [Salinicoccus hispanicus]